MTQSRTWFLPTVTCGEGAKSMSELDISDVSLPASSSKLSLKSAENGSDSDISSISSISASSSFCESGRRRSILKLKLNIRN
ncbi:unnamed protein product [Acanthoscelides obtectus]|uniref:Uncharacterized protein n=1 Tax=Acanthoscelides obtectus TaxID=200917 RepID=A0A9P0M3N6_ACAOB|nr:unnamed protein product [Acanthoscelides obtectus]CAK1663851.1 hypothetical protein AOBTE_LOCUS23896 [Acanthoscelides obtectus]